MNTLCSCVAFAASAVFCVGLCCWVGSVPCVCLSVSCFLSSTFLRFPFASLCNTDYFVSHVRTSDPHSYLSSRMPIVLLHRFLFFLAIFPFAFSSLPLVDLLNCNHHWTLLTLATINQCATFFHPYTFKLLEFYRPSMVCPE
jgi:hypothetical protein